MHTLSQQSRPLRHWRVACEDLGLLITTHWAPGIAGLITTHWAPGVAGASSIASCLKWWMALRGKKYTQGGRGCMLAQQVADPWEAGQRLSSSQAFSSRSAVQENLHSAMSYVVDWIIFVKSVGR